MKAFTLVASSIGLFLALQLGCSSGSDKPRNTGAGGGGDETGAGGGTASGGTSGKGGATGATGGTGGSATLTPDAAAGGLADATAPSPDATSSGGSGGQGGGSQGGAGGTPDGGPMAADTWDSFAKGFFATYCVSCHNDDKKGDATRDYLVLANVVKEKLEIACGTSKSQADFSKRGCSGFPPARQFPVGSGPKPTDADRDRLLRWIDSGTP